mgnify:CR=1 FL=1
MDTKSLKLLVLLSFFWAIGFDSFADDSASSKARYILGSVDYIGTDYDGAIGPDGQILNEFEYKELKEFASTAISYFESIRKEIDREQGDLISADLLELQKRLEEPKNGGDPKPLIANLRLLLIDHFKIKVFPDRAPSYELGRVVYENKCAACHDLQGSGNGPAAAGLNPKPRSFLDPEAMEASSPSQFYNTLYTGLDGTAMRSFREELSKDELWSVSFYAQSIRHSKGEPASQRIQALRQVGFGVEKLAQMTDAQLRQELMAMQETFDPRRMETADSWLVLARTQVQFADAATPSHATINLLNETEDQIKLATSKVSAGLFQEAEELLFGAYLEKFEGAEKVLLIVNKPVVLATEKAFLELRSLVRQADTQAYMTKAQELLELINVCRQEYERVEQNKAGPWGDFVSSFIIIVREGFEAFLVVAALLALISSIGQARVRRWIHIGWMTAIVAGGAVFLIYEKVVHLSGLAKETIEAISTSAAVVLLFYTGFWLLNQADMKRWNSFIRENTKKAISTGRLSVLFSISFIAVFREAVETIVFYQALFKLSHDPFYVILGFVVGCLVLFTVCLGIVRFNLKLPLRHFFICTSVLMVAISVVLAGKSIHELVEAGLIKVTPISWLPTIDMFGIYPSVETLLGQGVLLTVAIGLICRFFFLRDDSKPLA